MTVHFIGAGPGAADLITAARRELLAACPVCLYAGSIVAPELLQHCAPGAKLVDTAPMSLDEIEAEYVAAHAAGHDVARLHSGDLSVWSAVAEQIRRLEKHGIPYTLTPGVPVFRGRRRGARPRTDHSGSRAEPGADPRFRPRLENAGAARRWPAFGATGATLAIHLAIHAIDKIVARTDAALWRRLPGGHRLPRLVAGRARAARHACRHRGEAGRRPDRAHGDHFRRAVAGAGGFRESSLYDAAYQRRFRGRDGL